jgi:transposase
LPLAFRPYGASLIVTESALKKTLHAAEQDREDVKTAREEWREKQPSIDPRQLVFIDETGTTTNLTRLRGRAPKGQRLIGKTPHGHWKLTTFIAALRHDQITAPMVIDRPMNGEIFLAYVMTFLLPTLSKGDIVVMDNLAVHKVAGVVEAIEGKGAQVLYLPPYSPDLNPIEQMFAKLKALLRKAKERTIDNLWDRIGKLLSEFSAAECANYLANSGYAST